MTYPCPVCNSQIDENAPACPYCGFKLLGSTQSFQPVSLEGEISQPLPRVPRRASLRVVRGPQTGVVFQLGDETLSVGRSPRCDIFLNDMTVSREHADLVPVQGGYEVVDKRSFNGVWVNNVSVETYRLHPGDIMQIGAFLLLYQES